MSAQPGIKVESRTIDYVPESERTSKLWHQPPFWFLGNLNPLTLTTGFIGPFLGLSLEWTLVALTIGFLLGTAAMALHGSQGPILGLPQMIQTRAQLGYTGVSLAILGVVFAFFSSAVVMSIILGSGVNSVIGADAKLIGFIALLLAVSLAAIGHHALHRMFRWTLIVSLPLWLIVTITIVAFGDQGYADITPAPAAGFALAPFLVQLATATALNVSYAPAVSDYSRYLPRRTPSGKVIASVFFGGISAPLWLTFLGAWIASRLGVDDPIAALQMVGDRAVPGLGAVFVVVSGMALIASTGLCLYSASLGVITAVDAIRPTPRNARTRLVTLAILTALAIVVVLISDDSAVAAVILFLQIAGYLLVPWSAINLIDFFIVRKGHYAVTHLFRRNGVYGVWNRAGVPAYLIGLIVLFPFINVGFFVGPIAQLLDGVDIALFVGLVASGVAYLITSRRIDREAEKRAIAESDEELRALESVTASAAETEPAPGGLA
ncbi:MAG TPA: cytosine permease [Pseudolysinimonas sp.]|nr:cytosine permease [Pseudolysinimonas sp.]